MSLASVFTSFQSFRSSQSHYLEARQLSSGGQPVPEASDDVVLGQPGAVSGTYEPSKPSASDGLVGGEARTNAANTILSFIAGRLRIDEAEGASTEALSERLKAGLEGFLDGYNQAYEQLAGMGFLTGDVEQAIEKTYNDVLNGIEALAEELGATSPVTEALRSEQQARRASFVPAAPPEDLVAASEDIQSLADVSKNTELQNLRELISATTLSYEEQQKRSFRFSLTTQDGDTVSIRAAYASSTLLEGERVTYGNGEASSVSGSFRAESGFYLDIRGELDDEELAAIEDVLAQVKEVSDTFFSGNVEEAYQYALEMGFNSQEIAQFSLKLRYQSTARVQEGYQTVAGKETSAVDPANKYSALEAKDERLMQLARFVQVLEDLRVSAEKVGMEGFVNLPERQSKEDDSTESETRPVAIVEGLLKRLEQLAG